MKHIFYKNPVREMNSQPITFSIKACFLLWLLFLWLVPSLAPVKAQSYRGPVIINKGGTYKGNWESRDSEVAAVEIQTSEPVIIENSNIRGAGYLIKSWGYGANITIRHTNGYGLPPTPWKDYRKPRRFLTVNNFKNVVVENCYMENTAGIYLGTRYEGDGSSRNTVKIRYNKARNTDGRVYGSKENSQFAQFNFLGNLPHAEIAWNEIINEPNNSLTEDNINIFNSRGTPGSPIRIHNNYIQGAYPIPASGTGFTGGGIIADGDGISTSCSAYIDASNNQLINLGNHCMGIAGGNNIRYHHNRAINSALFKDGSRFAMYTSGLWSKDYYGKNSTFDNNVDHNTVGVTAWGWPNDRNDISAAENATYLYNGFLSGGAVAASVESNEYNTWTQKLKASGIVIGPKGGTTKSVNKAPSVSLSAPQANATFASGSTITIAANAADPDGYIVRVEFFQGSSKLGESNATHRFDWSNAASGTYSLTARATDDKGAVQTSAAVTVTVTTQVATSGSITREFWANVSGTSIKSIPVTSTPTSVTELTTFEAPRNSGRNYGQRIRGYITAPMSGQYTFWLDSDRTAELWLSTSEDPVRKRRVATMYEPWVHPRNWPVHPAHKSGRIQLEAGKRYYIEALMKHESGGDHLAVGWQLPDGSMERPIPGHRLSPITLETGNVSAALAEAPQAAAVLKEELRVYPNPFEEMLILYAGSEEAKLQEVQLLNLAGQQVYRSVQPEAEEGKYVFNLAPAGLAPGIYFLKYTDSAGRSKFVRLLKH